MCPPTSIRRKLMNSRTFKYKAVIGFNLRMMTPLNENKTNEMNTGEFCGKVPQEEKDCASQVNDSDEKAADVCQLKKDLSKAAF